MTTTQVINAALELLRVTPAGETPSPADSATALTFFNMLTANWSAKNRLVYVKDTDTLTLTASRATYTVGSSTTPASDINTAPYLDINGAWIQDGNIRYGLQIVNDSDILSRQQGINALPLLFNYTYPPSQATYNQATITLWPTPDRAYTLVIDGQRYLTSVTSANVGSELVMQPELLAALVYNLAVWLAPVFGATLDHAIIALAKETEKAIPDEIPPMADFAGIPATRTPFNVFRG